MRYVNDMDGSFMPSRPLFLDMPIAQLPWLINDASFDWRLFISQERGKGILVSAFDCGVFEVILKN